jgi:hemolysin III
MPQPTTTSYKAYSIGETRADVAAHIAGVTCGLVGTVVLMLKAGNGGSALLILGAALYGVGLLAMFGFSAAYNLWPPSPTKEMLRRFDHAAIFVMIAGTFTPLVMNRVGGDWGYGLLAFVWSVAAVGIAIKIAYPRRWERLTVALYVGLGLSIMIIGERLASAISPLSLGFLIAGSVTYIVGVVFHLWERLPYQNAIWHWLVLTAAVLHYTAVLNEVAAAAAT